MSGEPYEYEVADKPEMHDESCSDYSSDEDDKSSDKVGVLVNDIDNNNDGVGDGDGRPSNRTSKRKRMAPNTPQRAARMKKSRVSLSKRRSSVRLTQKQPVARAPLFGVSDETPTASKQTSTRRSSPARKKTERSTPVSCDEKPAAGKGNTWDISSPGLRTRSSSSCDAVLHNSTSFSCDAVDTEKIPPGTIKVKTV